MKQKTLLVGGLCVALGAYLYEIIKNYSNDLAFPAALTQVDWLRILFIGLFSMIFVGFLNRRKRNN